MKIQMTLEQLLMAIRTCKTIKYPLVFESNEKFEFFISRMKAEGYLD